MFSLEKSVLIFLIFVISLLSSFSPVSAGPDAGNVLAGLIGMVLGIVLICSFLGWWSRRGDTSRQTTGTDGQ